MKNFKKLSHDHLLLIIFGGGFTALMLFILIGKIVTKAEWDRSSNFGFSLFFVIGLGLLLIGIKLYNEQKKSKEKEDAAWRLRKIEEQMEKDSTGGY